MVFSAKYRMVIINFGYLLPDIQEYLTLGFFFRRLTNRRTPAAGRDVSSHLNHAFYQTRPEMTLMKTKNPDKKIRVLIADDHKLFCQTLTSLLNNHEGIEVVGQAHSGQAAVERSGELLPDIVLMDISFSDFDGTTATQRILENFPDIRIIALTMHLGREFFQKMMKAGASGYVVKDCGIEELLNAIQTVYDGKSYLCNEMAGVLIESYVSEDNNKPGGNLTEREREVLQCIADGMSTKQVADFLEVSAKTVETHRRQIMRKLGIFNIAQLTKFAVREGLSSLET